MSEFVEYLKEMMSGIGPITSRRMFGGYGIFHDGLMFGLVADDVLYLKADKQSAQQFVELGLDAFEYTKKGKVMKMSYYRAPEAMLDDPDEASRWTSIAYEAALRARQGK